ncbi:MAG: hypothetical protein V1744_06460 [Candidatus Altiarchaeota archaeon]
MAGVGLVELRGVFRRLDTPGKIQAYISSLDYNLSDKSGSPLWVLNNRKADCFDGALFAAACLQYHGMWPLLMDLRAVNDDDHTLAVYRIGGLWGAISKSNFSVLEFREPVYRSLRELAMSYFDLYFNTAGEKTLREYSRPLDLSVFDNIGWVTSDDDLDFIGESLDKVRHYSLITGKTARRLNKAGKRLVKAGLLGSNKRGLYSPKYSK